MGAWNGYEVAAVVFAAFAGFSGLAFSLALAFDPQGIMRALRGEAPLKTKRLEPCRWCEGTGGVLSATHKGHIAPCASCCAIGYRIIDLSPESTPAAAPARETAGAPGRTVGGFNPVPNLVVE